MEKTGAVSSVARLHAAFGLPLQQRCHEITRLLEEISVKDLYALLPLLLENMFGFGTQVGWSLGQLNRLHQPNEFHSIRQLLSPAGPLLKLVNRLSADSYLRFEFPVSCIPLPSQQLIEQGCISALYADKLQYNQAGKLYGMVSLSAFEYYFFHFSYYLVNPQHQKVPPWSNPTDVVYPTLVEEYLNYFLPLYTKGPSGQVIPSHVTSPTMHHSPLLQPSPRYEQSPSFPKLPFSSLLRSPSQTSVTPLEQTEQETWRSQSFLQIIIEFWLNQTSLDIERYTYSQPSMRGRWCGVNQRCQSIDPHQYIVLESFLPTGDHVRVVRMMVKHTHYFVNSASVSLPPAPYSPLVTCPLDEFKRMVIPQLLQKKMYAFLRHGFERWPLDSSFRLLMETWLSFIQPWRYTDPTQSNVDRVSDMKDRIVEKKWHQFVVDNLLFYSVLCQQFLHRSFRMDISAPKNAYMLFRVAKVFNLPNLREMLMETERVLYDVLPTAQGQSLLGDSYLAPVHSQLAAILAMQFAELERPSFSYQPLFHDHTLALVSQLLQLLRQARDTAKTFGQKMAESDWSLKSLLGLGPSVDYNASRFYNSDLYDDTASSGDWQRVGTHLEQAESYLCTFFDIKSPPLLATEPPTSGVKSGSTDKGQGPDSQDLSPDTFDTNNGPQLTPLGRYQLVNGLRKFNIDYQGDPDLQPIRSYENAFLVRMFYILACFINELFGEKMALACNRRTLFARILYQYLREPVVHTLTSTSCRHSLSPSSQLRLTREQRAPRVSLRWLASYQTLGYLAIAYLFVRLWFGVGVVGYVVILLVVALLYGIMTAFLPSSRARFSESYHPHAS